MNDSQVILVNHTGTHAVNTIDRRQAMQMALNAWGSIFSRTKLRSASTPDPRMNLEVEVGYPDLSDDVSLEMYTHLYERDAIAARVVEIWARESWQVSPRIYEDEDPEISTPFEEAWKELNKGLQGTSWRREEHGSAIWEYLKRVDELSGIGHFGILLLGLDDGEDLSKPVKGLIESGSIPVRLKDGPSGEKSTMPQPSNNVERYRFTTNKAKTKNRKLIYLRAFSEAQVEVQEWEGNFTSPRYGLPVRYSVTLTSPRNPVVTKGNTLSTREVHWTRVIHIADTHHTAPDDGLDAVAVPRMRPVLNNLLGLRKLYHGSPEMYWKAAFPGMALSTPPQFGDVDINVREVKDQLEEYWMGLDRSIITRGLQPQMLSPTVSDPTSQIDVQVGAICIKIGVPQRVFMGSEQGRLAADQDSATFYMRRVPQRQNGYLTPRMITPTVDRLIMVGCLPQPSEWYCWWDDITVASDQDKASLLQARTAAMAQYTSAGLATSLIAEEDYLTKEMGYSDDEAEQMLANVQISKEEAQAEAMLQQEEQLAQQEDMIARGLAPDPSDPATIAAQDKANANPFGKQPGKGQPAGKTNGQPGKPKPPPFGGR